MESRESFMTAAQMSKLSTAATKLGRKIPRSHDEMRAITGVARPGKTAADRASGAELRKLANREARKAWDQTSTGSRHNRNFPVDACNGKKNHRVH